MNTEIRYAEDPDTPGPGKITIVRQGGEWKVPKAQRPKNWKSLEQPIDDIPAQKPIVPTTNRKDTLKSERRPAHGPGRPRMHPPKAHPHIGRGKAWNRKQDISNEQIHALRAEGLTWHEIGSHLKIHPSTAHKRLCVEAKTIAPAIVKWGEKQ